MMPVYAPREDVSPNSKTCKGPSKYSFPSGARCGTDILWSQPIPVFHPEFGRFMLEATPGKPWGIDFKELLDVEPDMKLRYAVSWLWCLRKY